MRGGPTATRVMFAASAHVQKQPLWVKKGIADFATGSAAVFGTVQFGAGINDLRAYGLAIGGGLGHVALNVIRRAASDRMTAAAASLTGEHVTPAPPTEGVKG